MPVAAHQVFFERVAKSYDLKFHIADGRVRPAYTGLRVTVMAMLARHEGRVPLSRLMELVARTRYHGAVPAPAYQRLGKIWRRDHGFPVERILWDR